MHERLREELWKFGIISAYLFFCFLILELYRSSVLSEQHVKSLTLGIAFGKALILGKFILIGDAVKVGTRVAAKTVWMRIVWKIFLFWLTLVALTLVEEIVVGWFHGHTAMQAMGEYFGRPAIQYIAPSLVMLMILIPIITITELNRVLGNNMISNVLLAAEEPRPNESTP